MQKWWDHCPDRLEWELQKLDEACISWEKNEEAFEKSNGALFLEIKNGEFKGLKFTVVFPAYYPYMRFEIFSDEIDLEHHQNPFQKNLCFIGRASENWRPSDNVASFLTDRLPKVIKAGESNDPAIYSELEEPQAEPFSEYYTYVDNHIILFDSSLSIPEKKTEGLITARINFQGKAKKIVIVNFKDGEGNIISESSPELKELQYDTEIIGKWFRIPEPIKTNDPNQFFEALRVVIPQIKTRWEKLNKNLKFAIHCVVFPEEGVMFPEKVDHRKKGDGFIFLLRLLQMQKGQPKDTKNYFVRAGRSGKDDLASRNPVFKNLSDKKVAIIGLGCLGAPAALELSRCGVGELRILDYDFVEPGTIIRWPFGIDKVGESKVEVLTEFITKSYPFTKVVPFPHRLGEVTRDFIDKKNDIEILEKLLDGIDLIYDASAEQSIQHLFSSLAKERVIPYISTSTTYGAWSGSIVRIHPTKTAGCWMCYGHWLRGGQISGQLQDPNGKIQPTSCASPTFTGANFDTQEYALGGVRLAISTLSEGFENKYPVIDWDVANIYLRNEKGEHIPPDWKTFSIQQHPECSCQKNPKK